MPPKSIAEFSRLASAAFAFIYTSHLLHKTFNNQHTLTFVFVFLCSRRTRKIFHFRIKVERLDLLLPFANTHLRVFFLLLVFSLIQNMSNIFFSVFFLHILRQYNMYTLRCRLRTFLFIQKFIFASRHAFVANDVTYYVWNCRSFFGWFGCNQTFST